MDNIYYPQTNLVFIDRSFPSRDLPATLQTISVAWKKDENYITLSNCKGMAELKARLSKANLTELKGFCAPLADVVFQTPVTCGLEKPLHEVLDDSHHEEIEL